MPKAGKNRQFLLAIFFLFSLSISVHAQAPVDSTATKIDDTLTQKEAKLDSTSHQLDSLLTKKEAKLDTLKEKTDETLDKAKSISGKLTHLGDTLTPNLSLKNQKFDSLTNKLTLRIDSLNRIGQPTEKLTRKLDSLQQQGPFKQVNKAEQKITNLEKKITAPGDKAGQAINDKLSLMNKEGGSEANIPGQVNVPGLGAPGVNTPAGPGATLPGMPGGAGNPLGDMNLPGAEIRGAGGVSDPLKDIGSLPDKELGDLTNTDALNKATGAIDKVGQVGDEIKGYGDDLKNATSGNIDKVENAPKLVEDKVTQIDEVQGIQKEMGGADEYKEILNKGNDPDAMKDMAKKEAMKKAANHFAGKEEQLQGAMQKVSTMKQKYSNVKSIKDLAKHPPNPMKGKPFIERLVPGLVLQIQTSDHWLIDFNPVIGYKLGGRVNAGIGWNERLSIGSHFKTYSEEHIYGPRVYGEVKFGKGFALRADIEKMNTVVPPLGFVGTVGEGSRQWVWSAFVGLKKEYKFMKKVNGNFQFLYNLYDDHDNSPYGDRLVVRTGFEFPQRKKVRKQKEK